VLKAVIVDASALSRGLLNTVLTEGGYSLAGQAHTSSQGYALVQKFRPHFVCIAQEQVDDGAQVVEQIKASLPKTIVFMVAGALDAASLQAALARGVQGFIVKPFKADAVLKTIRNTVLATVKKQQG
jgi:two-component system chemotaxis response regulator CheY